ncbi:hypothetical protein KSS87_001279, partial [Heliosperma pusillum]
SLRVIMNDGLSAIPIDCLKVCIDVTGAYSTQKTELNISLTAIGLLWTTTDFIAKGLFLRGSNENGKIDLSSSEKTDGEWEEEASIVKKVSAQDSLLNDSERDELLITIFSLLQTLGADERPEVRNAAIRTLFQVLGTHGQKLSQGMWEDCLWNYVFPSLDRSSHLAATSSTDEWHGKELGTRDGKAVHMLIHHSRNTAQKQWDETLVVVLGGIARILRSFFPYLRTFSNFWSGWQSLINFVSSSILNGSKEVALAGINCLQTTVLSHSAKGNLPIAYLKSVLDVYGHVLLESSNHVDLVVVKVKQETLHGLGELFAHSYQMFDVDMYQQLLEVVHVVIQATITAESIDSDTLSSMWSQFLQSILKYLPRAPPESKLQKDEAEQGAKHETFNGASSASVRLMETAEESEISSMHSSIYSEKLIPVIIDVFLRAPDHEKYTIYPEIIQTLGRCMTTRRDCPDSAVWRLAVEGFNHVLISDIRLLSQKSEALSSISTAAKNRIWKEIADIYEIFLVGYCGRALSSNSMSTAALKADMSLDMAILSTLGDKILKSQIDAPFDILQRLVSTLDRCASRTCSLPVETVELLPPHCLRFSLASLQKLFTLTSFGNADDWNLTRLEISKIAVKVLMERCENIFNRLLIDEAALGDRPLPSARFEEVVYVLQELAHLTIHPDILSVLPLHSSLKHIVTEGNHEVQAHLLVLHPSLCELVVSREPRVRELVQVLLRLISQMLDLRKLTQPLQL